MVARLAETCNTHTCTSKYMTYCERFRTGEKREREAASVMSGYEMLVREPAVRKAGCRAPVIADGGLTEGQTWPLILSR